MLAEQLRIAEVWKAIDIYLAHAYPGPAPAAVRSRLDALRDLPAAEFFSHVHFERDSTDLSTNLSTDMPSKLSLRLGNKLYPHMKLTIERSPDRQSFLFRADTHDRHCCPAPGSRDHAAFMQLMTANQQIAQTIETAWAEQQVATFKTFLRDDLARRAKG